MIEIPFDPNIHIGPLAIAWHGIFTAVGILFGVWLPLRLIRPRVSEEDATAVATWGVVGGIIGARIVHVIDAWQYYLANPLQILLIWTGGIAIWGGAIGGVLAGVFVAVRRGLPIGFGADAAAPGIALGFAIGRIGDIINGEHWATACEPPLGLCVGFTHPRDAGPARAGASRGRLRHGLEPDQRRGLRCCSAAAVFPTASSSGSPRRGTRSDASCSGSCGSTTRRTPSVCARTRSSPSS